MKFNWFIYLFVLLFSVSTIKSFSQDRKIIDIKYSGFLEVDEQNYPDAKIFLRSEVGQVHIIHEGANMWCDKAIFYGKENFIEAYGRVKMKQGDTVDMQAKYVEYSGKTKQAFASGDVILTDPKSILTTDTLYFNRARQQSYYKSGGKVVRDSSATITSNIGRYYMKTRKFQFVDNVMVVDSSSVINTNRLDFYSDTGHAYMYGPSTITTEDSKTYCEKCFYDTEKKEGYAVKKSRIDYDARIFEGDSMYFNQLRNYASGTNNVKITDTLNNSILKGHYAEVFRAKDSAVITKRALAITLQDNDSIYMHSDYIMVTGKPKNRIIRAYYNVKLYKSNMSGKADSIHANTKTGLTQLINLKRFSSTDAFAKKRDPILWNIDNQMTGDTIHLKSNPETEKLDSLIVFNNAFLISKDSLKAGYNQIKGKRLVGLFNDKNEIYQVDINKNAESIFYTRNEEGELFGIDKAKSGSIRMFFEDNEIAEYRRLNNAEAEMYPEEDFPKNARELKGFVWREDERPNSVDDLFKDDPPLELPIIKGLEDYIQQDDFFDDELLDRIEKANSEANPKKEINKTKKKPAKASRKLPKNAKDKLLTKKSLKREEKEKSKKQ